MRLFSLGVVACAAALVFVGGTSGEDKKPVPAALNFKMKKIDGKEVDLSTYHGKVVLVVNVASRCGNTPQYSDLQKLYDEYGKDGLVILGVPANEFGKQEPGTNAQIQEFCTAKYGVSFDMLEKVVVKGDGICPLYQHLTSKETNPKFGGPITWNFEKFLIGRNGEVAARFKPGQSPSAPAVVNVIKEELAKK